MLLERLYVVNIMREGSTNPRIACRIQVNTNSKLEALRKAVNYLENHPSKIPANFHSLHVRRENLGGYVYLGK